MWSLDRKVIITENREGSLTIVFCGRTPEDYWTVAYLDSVCMQMLPDMRTLTSGEVEEYVTDECDQETIIYNTSGIDLGKHDVND